MELRSQRGRHHGVHGRAPGRPGGGFHTMAAGGPALAPRRFADGSWVATSVTKRHTAPKGTHSHSQEVPASSSPEMPSGTPPPVDAAFWADTSRQPRVDQLCHVPGDSAFEPGASLFLPRGRTPRPLLAKAAAQRGLPDRLPAQPELSPGLQFWSPRNACPRQRHPHRHGAGTPGAFLPEPVPVGCALGHRCPCGKSRLLPAWPSGWPFRSNFLTMRMNTRKSHRFRRR